MYTLGDIILDFTSNGVFSREILTPNGEVLCHVIEAYGDSAPAEALIANLNRG